MLCRDWYPLVQGEVKVDISIEASIVGLEWLRELTKEK